MLRAILWKEYRDQRLFALLLVIAGGAAVLSFSQLIGPGQGHLGSGEQVSLLLAAWLAVAWACGLVCGAMLLAGEREARTQEFLDTLPGNRWRQFAFKLVAGLAVLTVEMLLLLAFALVSGLLPAQATGEAFVDLFVVGLVGLVWGMFGGTFGRTVLGAVGAGIGGLFVAIWVVWFAVLLFLIVTASSRPGPGPDLQIFPFAVIAALTTLLGLAGAAWRYGRVEWRRRLSRLGKAQPTTRLVRSLRALASARSPIWLAWRQQRRMLLVLTIAVVPVAIAAILRPILVWPVASLAIGLLCGVTAFAEERQGGHLRFFADQRLPLGRIWVIQVGSRLLAAVSLGLLVLAVAVLAIWLDAEFGGHGLHFLPPGLGYNAGRSEELWYALLQMGPGAFLSLWLLHGFAIAQLCALLSRKSIVAVVLALLIAVPAAALWWPSLAGGGLAWWQPLFVPLLAIVLSRLLLPRATTDRLIAVKPAALLAGSALLGCAWMAGTFALRVTAVPNEAGDFPAAVAAFEAAMPSSDKDKARTLIEQAALEFKPVDRRAHQTVAISGFVQLPSRAPRSNNPTPDYYTLIHRVVQQGWPDDSRPLGPWLDRNANGGWVATLRAGVHQPLGMLLNPQVPGQSPQIVHDCKSMGEVLCARALQLEARGDAQESLQLLDDALALSRQVGSRATSFNLSEARTIEQMALRVLQLWTHALRGHPGLLEQAAALLDRHVAARPSRQESILADYLTSRARLDEPNSLGALSNRRTGSPAESVVGYLLTLGRLTPWEQERARRLLTTISAGYWRGSAEKTGMPEKLPDLAIEERQFYWFWFGWGPARQTATDPRHRLYAILKQSWAMSAMLHPWPIGTREHQGQTFMLEGTRTQMALARYAAQEHRPAAALADLVPKYLPSVPIDPFSDRPFGYRVSAGESILWRPTDFSGRRELSVRDPSQWVPLRLPAGTGILWSTGADGQDDGGKAQLLLSQFSYLVALPGTDLILLVPSPTRR